MSLLEIEAMKGLECVLASAIPELEGKICVGQGVPGHIKGTPSLAITAVTWEWEPFQAAFHQRKGPDAAWFTVGYHQALLQLRVTGSSPYERDAVTAQLTDLFLSTPWHPGMISVPVNASCGEKYLATFDLQRRRWDETDAGDRQYESITEVDAVVPALTLRRGVYQIHEIFSSFAAAFGDVSDTPETVVLTSAGIAAA